MVVEDSTKTGSCGGVTQECTWLVAAGVEEAGSAASGSGALGWNDAHVAAVLFNLECDDSYVAAFLLNLGIGSQA